MFKLKTILQDFSWYSVSWLFGSGLYFLSGIVIVKVLGPRDYGYWAFFLLLLRYGAYLHLGLFSALEREVPFYTASGDRLQAQKIINVVFTSLVVILVPLVVTFFVFSPWLFKLFSVLFLLKIFHIFLRNYFHCLGQFKIAAWLDFLTALSLSSFSLMLVMFWRISGLLLAYGIAYALVICFCLFKYKPEFRWQIDRKYCMSLFKIGGPLVLSGLFLTLAVTCDRFFVRIFFDSQSFGYYNVGGALLDLMMLCLLAVMDVMIVNFSRAHGKGMNDMSGNHKVLWCSLGIVLLASVSASVLLYCYLPLLLSKFFSEYLPGLSSARFQVFSIIPYSIVFGVGSYFMATSKHTKYICIFAGSLLLSKVIAILFVVNNNGYLSSISWVSLSVVSVFSMLMLLFILLIRFRKNEITIKYS